MVGSPGFGGLNCPGPVPPSHFHPTPHPAQVVVQDPLYFLASFGTQVPEPSPMGTKVGAHHLPEGTVGGPESNCGKTQTGLLARPERLECDSAPCSPGDLVWSILWGHAGP